MKRTLPWMLIVGMALGGTARAQEPGSSQNWGLATVADCEAPDGRTFVTSIVSLPDGTVRFEQVHPEQRVDMLLVPGEPELVFWRIDAPDGEWESAPAPQAEFVRGHDIHRRFLEAGSAGEIELALPDALGGGTVRLEFADLRPVLGVELPYQVDFHHDGERYRYRFRTVLPFDLAPGGALPENAATLFDRLGDLQEILGAHHRALRAHLEADIELLLADEAAAGTMSSRGRLFGSTREDTAGRLGPYLDQTRFVRYEDVVTPVVRVSADGTLGWLACEVEAEGEQTDAGGTVQEIGFGFSWVEMYARRGDRWVREGNASSARP